MGAPSFPPRVVLLVLAWWPVALVRRLLKGQEAR